jgi:hypothetical protein
VTDIVTVNETAMEPGGLFEGTPWPQSVTVAWRGSDGMGDALEITGECAEVIQFIADGWGQDEADGVREWLERERVA